MVVCPRIRLEQYIHETLFKGNSSRTDKKDFVQASFSIKGIAAAGVAGVACAAGVAGVTCAADVTGVTDASGASAAVTYAASD